MNIVIAATPIIFINPRTNLLDEMPLAMVSAYLPNGSDLNLEDAARVAFCRDEEAAVNLLESIPEVQVLSMQLDGTESARLAVEPPSLR